MRRKRLLALLPIFAITLSEFAYGYELATHAAITKNAIDRSVIGSDPQFLKNLGIDLTANNPFGEFYFDVSGSEAQTRSVNDFEKGFMPQGSQPLSLAGWLLRGAIREDDWTDVNLPGCQVTAPNPQEENVDRPKNHFYDPVHDWPLTLGTPLGKKAPDWSFGTEDVFADPNQPNVQRSNHYTVFDAREAMYRALTGKSKDNQDVAPTQDDRNKYWATLFRALGDIVHLVQDMGQSQHMRNASQINGTHYSRSYA